MSTRIFSFVKIADNSIVASVRLARFIRDILGFDICWDESVGENPAETLLIINGAFAFTGKSTLAALGAAIEAANRVVWVQQDYTIIPPKDESGAESPFRKAFRNRFDAGKRPIDYWTTVEPMSRPGRAASGHIVGPGSKYVNWNCLTFDQPMSAPRAFTDRPFGAHLLYYGSYRKDREAYFRRYLSVPYVPTMISCPTQKFFVEGYVDEKISHYDRVTDNLHSFLGLFGLGLYLEDKKSHTEYHSPANRFYEMLSAGLPMVFQPEAAKQLMKAELDIDDFVVWNAGEIPKMMEKREDILISQRKMWLDRCARERSLLPENLRNLWAEYQAS